jgi:hypothetical protein
MTDTPVSVDTLSRWGGRPPIAFLLAETPVARPQKERSTNV